MSFSLISLSGFLFMSGAADARRGQATGPNGPLWKDKTYGSDALATLQGSARRAWSRDAKGWDHTAIDPGDGLLEEWWCQGVSQSTCWTGSVTGMQRRGVAWRSLGAQLEEGQIDGIWFSAGNLPTVGSWGVSVRLEVTGTPVAVSDFEVRFVRLVEDAVTEEFVLAPLITHTVEQTDFSSGPADAGTLGFDDLWTSVETFAAAAEQVDVLMAQVLGGLERNEVRKCSYGRYSGEQNPLCRKVALTAHDQDAWRAQVERDLSHRATLIRSDAELLQEQLRTVLPVALDLIFDGA